MPTGERVLTVWVGLCFALIGVQMLRRRARWAHELATSAKAFRPRHGDEVYAGQMRVAKVFVPIVGVAFIAAGLSVLLVGARG